MYELITTQLKRAREIATKGLAFAGAAASVLDPRLNSYLQQEGAPVEVAKFQLALMRWMEDDHDRLESLEAVNLEAMEKLTQLRTRRNAQQGALYTELLAVRTTFETAFGTGTASKYLGLETGMNALGDDVLRRVARKAIRTLTDPGFESPEPVVQGIWEDAPKHAQRIQDRLEPFEATLKDVLVQRTVVETAQRQKKDLLDEVSARSKWSTRIIEALLHLAGLGYHADRLRSPVSTRSGSSGAPPDADPDGDVPLGSDGSEPGGVDPAPGDGSEAPPAQPDPGDAASPDTSG